MVSAAVIRVSIDSICRKGDPKVLQRNDLGGWDPNSFIIKGLKRVSRYVLGSAPRPGGTQAHSN